MLWGFVDRAYCERKGQVERVTGFKERVILERILPWAGI